MQAIAMRKDDIPVAVSTVVLAIVTITYKLVLVAVGTVVMLLRPGEIMSYLEGVENLVDLGLALNIGCIAILLMMVFRPSVVRSCAESIWGGLNRIRAFKHPEKISGKLNSSSSFAMDLLRIRSLRAKPAQGQPGAERAF